MMPVFRRNAQCHLTTKPQHATNCNNWQFKLVNNKRSIPVAMSHAFLVPYTALHFDPTRTSALIQSSPEKAAEWELFANENNWHRSTGLARSGVTRPIPTRRQRRCLTPPAQRKQRHRRRPTRPLPVPNRLRLIGRCCFRRHWLLARSGSRLERNRITENWMIARFAEANLCVKSDKNWAECSAKSGI